MKKFKNIWRAGAVILLAAFVLALVGCGKKEPNPIEPTLTVETPQKLSAANKQEFALDIEISSLGDARYPAMSMSISFDASRLEFLGIEEGNVFVLDANSSAGRKLPDWRYNVKSSNETGVINIMYLDITGGKNAFHKDLLSDDENIVLRLNSDSGEACALEMF